MPANHDINIEPPNSGSEFESMVTDYYKMKWGESMTNRHASSGQSDDGIDIYGQPPDIDGYAGVQCKRTKDLSKSDIYNIIEKAYDFNPQIDRLIIFWSGETDKNLQEKVILKAKDTCTLSRLCPYGEPGECLR
jgi:hypothetical protein